MNINQYAYRDFHSTETVLLKVQKNLDTSMDKGTSVGLVLLDLSAAFEIIDHSILFDWCGIDRVVLKWVQSYLDSRKQRIKIGGYLSDAFELPYRLPQFSVLGPLVFTLNTTLVNIVISKLGVADQFYGGDTQVYLEFD